MWGGVQAQRIAAASQALGAPRGVQKAPKANLPRYLNKASGKMETAKAMKAFRMPTGKPPGKPPGGGSGGGSSGPSGPPSFLAMTPAQLDARSHELANAQGKTELTGLQNQNREISSSEAAAQARLKALGEQQNTNLQGISQQAEASAKTNENRAADLALKTGKSVETAGQAEAGQLGGYVSPELKAQMLAAGQRASETSGAGQSLAQQSGQNEVNYLQNLRAAAAAKAIEGSRQLAAPYAKSLAENANKEREIPGRTAANFLKLSTELPQKQFDERATAETLKMKGAAQTASEREFAAKHQGEERGRTIAKENAERAARTSRENTREHREGEREGHSITQRHYEQSDQIARERAKHEAAKAALNPSATKATEGLGSAFQTIRQLREQKLTPAQIDNALSTGYLRANERVKNSKTGEMETKPTTYKYSKVDNGVIVKAAWELWNRHEVSPGTRAALKAMGITGDPKTYVGL